MTPAASVPFFRRYRVLSIMVLVLTVVSIIQINSGGIGKKSHGGTHHFNWRVPERRGVCRDAAGSLHLQGLQRGAFR